MPERFRPGRPAVAELAAGGIVRRRTDGRILVLHERAEDRWCFPKGHVEAGETLEEAAVREIREESGLGRVDVLGELREVHYRHYRSSADRNVLKTVVYFLVQAEDAPLRLEDGFDEGRWVAPDEARRLVAYPTDRMVLDALPSVAGDV